MTAKKRDQRQYDLVQQYLPGPILNPVLGIIRELGDPYDAKPGLGGMTAYPLMAIVFDSEYHQRSIIEFVFAALKKMYGDCTRCRRPDNRTREILIRATCYDIGLVARSQAKDGRLIQDRIATLAA